MTFTEKAQELKKGCSNGCNFPIQGESGIVYCYVCVTKISQMREDLQAFNKYIEFRENNADEIHTQMDWDISQALKVLDGGK